MTTPLVFMDTETTGLSLDDDIWEFAAIRREPDGAETELHLFLEHDRKKCAQLPEKFRDDHYDRFRDHRAIDPHRAIDEIQDLFHADAGPKPHVVGAVPNFDTERIAAMCRRLNRSVPAWHYHLIDVENLAVGYLMGNAHFISSDEAEALRALALPPWKSDDIAETLGVTIDEKDRHTAMGDARWAMRIYDAVMDGAR